ncbi:MAG: tRNA guanosine(34) transglycosylase Tgt [Legionellaceae bacterium]|nr:tRNA guanosine(34) transglycosylase Tgt [Legionellaceae bacterium]
MKAFSCEVLAEHAHTRARVTEVHTAHGSFVTPTFMPVGTRAGVNNVTPAELQETGSQIILGGNTYHMLCAPGMQVIQDAGGMHAFMGWKGPMLTDSGGFQVFSLSKNGELCTIDETGARFVIPGQSSSFHMTPEASLQTQKIIGADIIMAFDQCTPSHVSPTEAEAIMHRTHRWLQQSIAYHTAHPTAIYGYPQALFGIIQGGVYPALRAQSAEFVTGMPLDGIAIGGETVGFDMPATCEILQHIFPYLPRNKPRYTMGVGMSPQDLLDVVAEGIDIFDCVAPTRNARHGALYCGQLVESGTWLRFESTYQQGRLLIKKAQFSNDENPIMPGCSCYTCLNYSRAFLHHSFKQKNVIFSALASIHNIHVMQEVCGAMRAKIQNERDLSEPRP